MERQTHKEILKKLNKRFRKITKISSKDDKLKTVFVKIFATTGNLDIVDEHGNTPLHYAVKMNSVILTAYLLENDCNVNVTNKAKESALYYAVRNNNLKIAKMLIYAGTTFKDACDYRIRRSFDLPLIAINNDNLDMVKLLLANCRCELSISSQMGYERILYIFANVNSNLTVDVVEALVDAGMDLRAKCTRVGFTVLHYAVSFNVDRKIIELLVRKGADINQKNSLGQTSLVVALVNKRDHIAELLIDLGGKVDWIDGKGRRILHYAVRWSGHALVKLLLERTDVPINVFDNDGFDPLGYCLADFQAHFNFDNLVKCIDLLLRHGADVNRRYSNGLTPLTTALKHAYQADIVQYLLDRGAELDFEDDTVREVLEIPNDESLKPLILIRHVALFEAQNRTDGPLNFDRDLLNAERQNDYARCRDELELMRTSYSFGSMSLYKLLIGKVVGPYARNDRLAAAFESREIGRRFPIYEDILTRRFAEEKEKLKFGPGAVKSLGRILGCHVDAQPIIFDKIVYYLDKDDLKSLTLI